jgi:hypothetical protein
VRQAVVLKHTLVFLRDSECLDATLVFQLKTRLRSSILHCAENLND